MTKEDIVNKLNSMNGNMIKVKKGNKTIYVNATEKIGETFDAVQVYKSDGSIRVGKWGHVTKEIKVDVKDVVDVIDIKCENPWER